MTAGAGAQLTRMMALVPYLQERQGIAIDQVARDFGTTPQQILRDLNVLWFCGLPNAVTGEMIDIDMDAAEGEGIITLRDAEFLARPMKLSPVEAAALAVALRSLRDIAPAELRPAVDSALAKIESAARDESRLAVHISADEQPPALADVERATADGQQIEIDYLVTSRDEVTTRVVDPVRLLVADGQTYLEAWCHRAQGLRTFRLDRIERVTPTGQAAERHEAPQRAGTGVFHTTDTAPTAVVRLDVGHRWVPDYFPVEHTDSHEDGSVTVHLRYTDPEWLIRFALRLGGGATVVEPADVAAEVVRRATAALAAYSD